MLIEKRNIAIFAHADAGKTSLTEQILHLCGRIKKPGSVDDGTTHTDFLPVEKERGISVRSAYTSVEWKGIKINLADTPGHVDFAADTERIMRAIDAAVLVVSAVEGLQANAINLWVALKTRNIPVLLFINKIDRTGSDVESVINEMKREWNIAPLCLQEIDNQESLDVNIKSVWSSHFQSENLIESVVSNNDKLLEMYFAGNTPSYSELRLQLSKMIASRQAFPLLYGSSKLSIGIKELLDTVVEYLPNPNGEKSKHLSALAFGVSFDKTMGKIALIRIFDGSIGNRELVFNATRQTEEKVVQIRQLSGNKFEEIQSAEAGDIVGVCGLASVEVGDLLGVGSAAIAKQPETLIPLLTVQVKAVSEKDYSALAAALQQLYAEDPMLRFEWLRNEAEMNISAMGWIQMEVLERILLDRFGIDARFENPTVIYRETPSKIAEGFVRYWMPKPCWAIMKFRIEPGESGSGVVYSSTVGVDNIAQKYQNEVERTIASSLKQGIKGWEVTDIRITLIEGEDHEVHTHPGDFAIATPMGIMNGLVNSGTTLLEPMVSFKIRAVEELLGAIASDITKMRGRFESPEMEDGKFILRGMLPVATSQDYSVKLSSRSGGKANISTQFAGYQPCADELGVIRPYHGISPLDEAKWILKARGAMQ